MPHDVLGFSLFPYHKEREDADGDPLWWPGGPTGLPVRGGSPRAMTNEEWENMPVTFKVRVRTFDMRVTDDIEAYRGIAEKSANGYFQIRDREKVRDKETGEILKIFLEWAEPAHIMEPSSATMPLPTEGQTYAITGPNSAANVLDAIAEPNDPRAIRRPVVGPPGLWLDQARRSNGW